MSTTTLIGPDGRQYDFDASAPGADLAAALKAGYRQATPDAPQTLGESALGAVSDVGEAAGAAATGLASGLTAGLSDVALGLTQPPEVAKERALQREESPYASTAGELVGMVASPLNAVGGAATQAVGATTRLGRIGAQALGGAAVGGLFGAGSALSDASLGDSQLTAEKLVSSAGLGALLGGVGGGLGGLLDEGIAAVAPKVGKAIKGTQGILDDVANDSTIQATRAAQGELNKIGDERLAAAARAIRERGHLELTPDKMGQSLAKDREALGATLGKFLDDVETAGARPDFAKVLKRLDDFEATLNPLERKAISSDLGAAREAVDELLKRPTGTIGKGGSSFRALDDLKQTIQAKAKFSKGPVPLDDVTFGLKRQLAGNFRDELDQQLLPALGADAGKAFTDSKALYGALKDAERLAASGAGRAAGFGLKDIAMAAAGASAHPLGIAAGLGSRLMRENGQAIIARVADRLAKSPAIDAIAKSFAAQLTQVAPRLGAYGPVLLQEARLGPQRALAAHVAYAQVDPHYAATAQLAGLEPEAPDTHAATLQRATGLAGMEAALKQQDEAVKKGIEKALKGAGSPKAGATMKSQDFGAQRMRRGATEAYAQRVDEVRKLAADPEALLERVTANLGAMGGLAPNVSAGMTATAQRAVAYLSQAAAVPPKAGPLAPEWEANEAERFDFQQKLQVVQQPMSVLEDAAAGTLTETQIEALRAVYPGLAKQMADEALQRLVESPKGVPYRARLMVSLLTGVDPDGTLSAEAIAANQAAIAAAGKRNGDGAPGSPDGDAGSISLAQRSATPQQRRELGGDE